MNKIFGIILISFLYSCHLTSYKHYGDVNIGIDFTQGKWLLNKVQPEKKNLKSFNETVYEKFHQVLGDRVSKINEVPGILFPSEITENIDRSILRDIKNGTNYDYFITVQISIISSESDSILINDIESDMENSTEVTINIYDLNTQRTLYSHTVKGENGVQEGENDVSFIKNAHSIIYSSINRIFKKLNKHSIK